MDKEEIKYKLLSQFKQPNSPIRMILLSPTTKNIFSGTKSLAQRRIYSLGDGAGFVEFHDEKFEGRYNVCFHPEDWDGEKMGYAVFKLDEFMANLKKFRLYHETIEIADTMMTFKVYKCSPWWDNLDFDFINERQIASIDFDLMAGEFTCQQSDVKDFITKIRSTVDSGIIDNYLDYNFAPEQVDKLVEAMNKIAGLAPEVIGTVKRAMTQVNRQDKDSSIVQVIRYLMVCSYDI